MRLGASARARARAALGSARLGAQPSKYISSEGFKNRRLFGKVKYLTVKKNIESIVQAFDDNHVPADNGSFFLPLNIVEATTVDFVHGLMGNAYAGVVLAVNNPGAPEPDEKTGRAPTRIAFSKKHDKGRQVQYFFPLGASLPQLLRTPFVGLGCVQGWVALRCFALRCAARRR